MDQQKPKTQRKMTTTKNYEVIYCKMCRNGYRISKRIQWITLFSRINILPALLMNYQWSREQKVVPGPGKHSIKTHFPKDRNCDICLKTKINKDLLQKTYWYSRAQSGKNGDLITTDPKVLGEGCESRHDHRYAVVVQDLATQRLQSYTCKTKTSQETQKSLQKFLEPTRNQKPFTLTILWNVASLARNYPGIIVRQHHTDQKQMALPKEHCAQSEKRDICDTVAIWSG